MSQQESTHLSYWLYYSLTFHLATKQLRTGGMQKSGFLHSVSLSSCSTLSTADKPITLNSDLLICSTKIACLSLETDWLRLNFLVTLAQWWHLASDYYRSQTHMTLLWGSFSVCTLPGFRPQRFISTYIKQNYTVLNYIFFYSPFCEEIVKCMCLCGFFFGSAAFLPRPKGMFVELVMLRWWLYECEWILPLTKIGSQFRMSPVSHTMTGGISSRNSCSPEWNMRNNHLLDECILIILTAMSWICVSSRFQSGEIEINYFAVWHKKNIPHGQLQSLKYKQRVLLSEQFSWLMQVNISDALQHCFSMFHCIRNQRDKWPRPVRGIRISSLFNHN